MDGARVDAHEVRQLARDLSDLPVRVLAKIPPVLKHGAVNIKAQLRAEMRGSFWFKGVTPSIAFDVPDGGFGVEVGPESEPGGMVGDLASIAYFGSSRGGGASVPDPQGALDAEAPKTEKAIADLIGDL
jgi:hypothetical protein